MTELGAPVPLPVLWHNEGAMRSSGRASCFISRCPAAWVWLEDLFFKRDGARVCRLLRRYSGFFGGQCLCPPIRPHLLQ